MKKNITKQNKSGDLLSKVNLTPLMKMSNGNPDLVIGMIDGHVDLNHPAFKNSRIDTVRTHNLCKKADSKSCMHGTFVTGVLCGDRALSPGICPNCKIILYPIFNEHSENGLLPTTAPEKLASAIIETINAGANIINLSLGMSVSDLKVYKPLEKACIYAYNRGVILVAASGNQGVTGHVSMFNNSWITPVVACDESGKFSPDSNIGLTIGRRGLMAPGVDVTSTAPGGKYTQMTGTSVATPFVTGAIALLWSLNPSATAAEIRFSIQPSATHKAIIPPLLNAGVALQRLKDINSQFVNHERSISIMAKDDGSGPTGKAPGNAVVNPADNQDDSEASQEEVESCPTCAGSNKNGVSFIYAMGTISVRFPTLGIEKEYTQAIQQSKTDKSTDSEVIYKVLKENRYLAREVCFVLSIEGVEVYILIHNDPVVGLEELVEGIKPGRRQGTDCDIVIGDKGGIAPPSMCNGLQVPIVYVDRVYSFDISSFIKAIPNPESKKKSGSSMKATGEEVFYRIMQLTDNVGELDAHRAINYLALRYPRIYHLTAEKFGENFSFTSVEVQESRLSGVRKLLDVIFSYTNRNTDVLEKYYVRVDVTEKFPFLANKMTPFYDR